MTALHRLRPQPDDRIAFFQAFLKRPKQVGSIIPSSRFLERRVIRSAELGHARTIVELGPGTGGITRALLRAVPSDARVLVIEVNPRLADVLRRMRDPRLIVHEGDASDLGKLLALYDLDAPDVILSGIPFSTMHRQQGRAILRAVHDALQSGGLFVAYQVRDRVASLGREVFGPARVQTEILNVPPMRVYRWRKGENGEHRPARHRTFRFSRRP
jgi:phosphatidylethanolamine/phosphatidyl-N-methylethanolamine N-methyltransferase